MVININHENHDIAIAMSSSRADPVLGSNILQAGLEGFKCFKSVSPWVGVFIRLFQSHCTDWGNVNV